MNRRATGSNMKPKVKVRHEVFSWCSQKCVMKSRLWTRNSQDCPGTTTAALRRQNCQTDWSKCVERPLYRLGIERRTKWRRKGRLSNNPHWYQEKRGTLGKTARPNGQNRSSDPSIDWELRGEPNGDEKEDFRTIPIGSKKNGEFGSE
ncbi:hypothetical protein NPIL_368411 [Nephila pilipes]|uniref:Uncharacterized protein n=1 Tax=Nephila pilipes TaxID=299642 RepID=A0A8X6THT6_NEPPI|nr:hypothetical protein NPIL_368411 [Nephila pilipes]